MQKQFDKETLMKIAINEGKDPKDKLTLNLGCGEDTWGDIRVDFTTLANGANVIADLNLPLPFPDKVFSKVLLRGVIEHMMNPGKLILEVYRVLMNNGEIEILTDNAAFFPIYFHGQRHSGGYIGRVNNDKHFMVFHPSHLKTILETIGFYKIEVFYERFVDLEGQTGRITKLMERIGNFISIFKAPISISQYFYPMICIRAKKL